MAWQGDSAWQGNKGTGDAGGAGGAGAGAGAGGEVTAYTAKWCGYSKKLRSQLEENKADLDAKGIKVNLIECTDEAQKPLCDAASVKGYPHMVNSCGQENPGWVDHDRLCEFAQCQ